MLLDALSVLAVTGTVNAHIALWHPSMFGYNYPFQASDPTQKHNSNEVIKPLSERPLSEWFAHGMKGFPPLDGQFFELPVGGHATAELSSTRAGTSYRDPKSTTPLPEYVCVDLPPVHIQGVRSFDATVSPANFGPTALAIAYTSDADTVQPADFTVISTNNTSPWWRETRYDIPAGLGQCGAGGCLCTWNWIHLVSVPLGSMAEGQAGNGAGYGGEIYNVVFRCQVTGATSPSQKLAVGGGRVPVKCDGDASKCVQGLKQPMYLWQKEGNNMKESYDTPPTYNERYGFTNGAQDVRAAWKVRRNLRRRARPGAPA